MHLSLIDLLIFEKVFKPSLICFIIVNKRGLQELEGWNYYISFNLEMKYSKHFLIPFLKHLSNISNFMEQKKACGMGKKRFAKLDKWSWKFEWDIHIFWNWKHCLVKMVCLNILRIRGLWLKVKIVKHWLEDKGSNLTI